jgi:hypothetical protein
MPVASFVATGKGRHCYKEGFGRLLLHRKEKIPVGVNGRSVLAKVIDECDSVYGCHEDHKCTTLNPMPQQHLNASRAL